MRKSKLFVPIACVIMALCISTAYAAQYPVSVEEKIENGYPVISKTYALSPEESPDDIPTSGFMKYNVQFTATDIIKKENRMEDRLDHTEIVTISTSTNDLQTIIAQLEPEISYEKDGYSGVLYLDISTIDCQVAGHKSSTYEVTKTREYPNLSSNDLSLVPKTITEGGKTYSLKDANFKAQNTVNIDYNTIPNSYVAVATYTGTATSTSVTGYQTTAAYVGTIEKVVTDKVYYTVNFLGEPLEEPEPEPEVIEEKEPSRLPIIILTVGIVLLVVGAIGAIVYFTIKTKRDYNVTVYAQTGKEFKKIRKIKMDLSEPVIDLNSIKLKNDSRNFVLELSDRAYKHLVGGTITIEFEGREETHVVDQASDLIKYQFEVHF